MTTGIGAGLFLNFYEHFLSARVLIILKNGFANNSIAFFFFLAPINARNGFSLFIINYITALVGLHFCYSRNLFRIYIYIG